MSEFCERYILKENFTVRDLLPEEFIHLGLPGRPGDRKIVSELPYYVGSGAKKRHQNCVEVIVIQGDSGQVNNYGRGYRLEKKRSENSLLQGMMNEYLNKQIHAGQRQSPIVVSSIYEEKFVGGKMDSESRKKMANVMTSLGKRVYDDTCQKLKERPEDIMIVVGGAHYYSKPLAHALADSHTDKLIVPIVYDRHLDCRRRDPVIGDTVLVVETGKKAVIQSIQPASVLKDGFILPPMYHLASTEDIKIEPLFFEEITLISDGIEHSGSWSAEMIMDRDHIDPAVWIGYDEHVNNPTTVANALRVGHKTFHRNEVSEDGGEKFAQILLTYLKRLEEERDKRVMVFSSTCGDTINGWSSSAETQSLGFDSRVVDTIDEALFSHFSGIKHIAELDPSYCVSDHPWSRMRIRKNMEELWRHLIGLARAHGVKKLNLGPVENESIMKRLENGSQNQSRHLTHVEKFEKNWLIELRRRFEGSPT